MNEYEEFFVNEYIRAFTYYEKKEDSIKTISNAIKKKGFFKLNLNDFINNKIKKHLEIQVLNSKTIIKIKGRSNYCVIHELEKLINFPIHYDSPMHETLKQIFNIKNNDNDKRYEIFKFLNNLWFKNFFIFDSAKSLRIIKDLILIENGNDLVFIHSKEENLETKIRLRKETLGFLNNYKLQEYNYLHEDDGFYTKGFLTLFCDSNSIELSMSCAKQTGLENINTIKLTKSGIKINKNKNCSAKLFIRIIKDGLCYFDLNDNYYNRSLLNTKTNYLYLPYQEHILITDDFYYTLVKDSKTMKKYFLIIDSKNKKIHFLNKEKNLLLKTLEINNTEENIKKICNSIKSFNIIITECFNSNEFYLLNERFKELKILNLNIFTITEEENIKNYKESKFFKTYLEELKRKILIKKLN